MKTSTSVLANFLLLVGIGINSMSQACTLDNWSAVQDTAGNLSTAWSARYTGSCGLITQLNGTSAAFVEDNSPGLIAPAVDQYRARFYLYVDSVQMDVSDSITIFSGTASNYSPLFNLKLTNDSVNSYLDLEVYDDLGAVTNPSGTTILRKGWRAIEVAWAASGSAGSNNGSVSLLVDNEIKQSIASIDNDTHRVGAIRIGGVSGNTDTVSGRIDFDAFNSQRTTNIGLISKNCASSQASLSIENTTFLSGSTDCIATSNVQLGYRTTIDSGTNISIRAPSVSLTSGVSILSGASVMIGQ